MTESKGEYQRRAIMTDKSKTPAFNLHKKPEPLPDAVFTVTKDKEGVMSIEMRCGQHVTLLGGLTMKEIRDLASILLNVSSQASASAFAQALSDPQANCKSPFMGQYGPVRRSDSAPISRDCRPRSQS